MPAAHDVPLLRSIVAVLAGFFAVMMLGALADMVLERAGTGAPAAETPATSNALLIKLVYETVFAFIAGYIAARVGVRKPYVHALVMALLVLIGRAILAAVTWEATPAWFHIGVLVLIVPAALSGAKLCEFRSKAV